MKVDFGMVGQSFAPNGLPGWDYGSRRVKTNGGLECYIKKDPDASVGVGVQSSVYGFLINHARRKV